MNRYDRTAIVAFFLAIYLAVMGTQTSHRDTWSIISLIELLIGMVFIWKASK